MGADDPRARARAQAGGRSTAARIQTATWGLLIIWVGIMMASTFDNENPGIGLTVLGSIFLVSGLVQRTQARREGGGFIVAGVTILLLGINDLLDQNLTAASIAVIVIGVLILASVFRKPVRRGPPIDDDESDR